MDDNTSLETYICSRCGNEVNRKSRYCMKCGNLNPDHPDNAKYLSLINQNGKMEYQVGENGISVQQPKVNQNEVNAQGVLISFGDHMGSFNLCFFLNYFFFLFLCIGLFISQYMVCGDFITLARTDFSYVLFILSLLSIFTYSYQLLFMKMNTRWWLAFLPIVNLYFFAYAINHNKLLSFLVYVPVIGEFYLLDLYWKLGKAFRSSGLLTILFPFIMIPIFGFGSSAFEGVCYISGRDTLEKEYSKKKLFLVSCVICIILSLVMIIFAHTVQIHDGIDEVSSYYLYYASQKVVKRTKLRVEKNLIDCDQKQENTIYLHFQDLEDYFSLPFYVYRDPIEAVIKVYMPNGEGDPSSFQYYISMTDGTYGYPETPVDQVRIKTIQKYKELDSSYESGNQCYFKRSA